jgi:hypothetical protein
MSNQRVSMTIGMFVLMAIMFSCFYCCQIKANQNAYGNRTTSNYFFNLERLNFISVYFIQVIYPHTHPYEASYSNQYGVSFSAQDNNKNDTNGYI